MEYQKLISVMGLSGLFELISNKKDGAIIKSLEDGSIKFASSRIHQFSQLESIEVFTTTENVNLAKVFIVMGASSIELPNEKDASLVKDYFQKVYPEIDFDRVYASDLKKMVKWYSIIKKNKIEIKETTSTNAEEILNDDITKQSTDLENPVQEKKIKVKKTTIKKAE